MSSLDLDVKDFVDVKKEPAGGPAAEELLRSLIGQITTRQITSSSARCASPVRPAEYRPRPAYENPGEEEEIVLDIDVDGARYLLIRMPLAAQPRVQLSPREQEIARMVAQGHPNKIIADVLNISSWTVGTHLRRIFAKLGVSSRAAMVARIRENGNPRKL